MLSANQTACDVRALFEKAYTDQEIADELKIPLETVEKYVVEYIDNQWDNHLEYLANHPFCFTEE